MNTADTNCRFELFVRLKDSKHLTGAFIYNTEWSKKLNKRCFCFLGNKFTDVEVKQLINLKSLANRLIKTNAYSLLVIRDRTKLPKENEIVEPEYYTPYKWYKGLIEYDTTTELIKELQSKPNQAK